MATSDPLLPKNEETSENSSEDDDERDEEKWSMIKGCSLSLIGAICFAARNFITSVQTKDIDPTLVTFLERALCIPFGAVYCTLRGCSVNLDKVLTLSLIAGGLLTGILILLLIWAFSLIAVGDAVAAGSIVPASTGVLAWCLIGERFTCKDVIFSSIGIAGVVFISKPAIFLELTDENIPKGPLLIGTAVAASTSVIRSVTQIMYRYVGRYDVDPSVSVMFVSVFSTVPSIVACSVFATWSLPDRRTFMVSILAASQGLSGALLSAEALRRIKTMHHSLIQLSVPIFTYSLDIILQGTVPDWQSVLGCALIITSSLAIIGEPKDDNAKSDSSKSTGK